MKKALSALLAVLLTSVLLSGCGYFDRKIASTTGWSRICIDGVSYLQFASGASVEYNLDGKPKPCK